LLLCIRAKAGLCVHTILEHSEADLHICVTASAVAENYTVAIAV
jgi:hypothetical protein